MTFKSAVINKPTIIKSSLENIQKVAQKLDEVININSNNIVMLNGDLASGKTTLVKAYVKQMDFDDSLVTSPTFSIMNKYTEYIYHYDIYSKGSDMFLSLGFLDECQKKGVHFIEWGDEKLKNIFKSLKINVLEVTIKDIGEQREYTINA